MLININPINPQLRLIRKVVDVLREGGIVAYPTDTVYGFAVSIYSDDALARHGSLPDLTMALAAIRPSACEPEENL